MKNKQLFRAIFGLLGVVGVLGVLTVSGAQMALEAVEPTPMATPAVFAEPDTVDPLVCDVSTEIPVPVCHALMLADAHAAEPLAPQSDEPCVDGLAAGFFPCENVDLLSFVPLVELEGLAANDIWGWTDGETGREYALVGLNNGTVFVDVTEPITPVIVGRLPTHTNASSWRDIKVYQDHAYVVADVAGGHGLQVFDLTQLRNVTTTMTFTGTVHYDGIGDAHNIIINEDSGFAYLVGGPAKAMCGGGLHMINIQEPADPVFVGCFVDDGYTHDAQCVMYHGPDAAYTDQEICFNANTDSVAIVDVSNKARPRKVGTASYSLAAYTHQVWLTADHHYMLVNDEFDELSQLTPNGLSQTYVFDIRQLDKPELIGTYTAVEPSIDHNMYIHEGYVYQSNYQTGLRILDAAGIEQGQLQEVAYFDTYPNGNNIGFNGAWSNYPFFESGIVVVSSIEQGLFVLQLSEEDEEEEESSGLSIYFPYASRGE